MADSAALRGESDALAGRGCHENPYKRRDARKRWDRAYWSKRIEETENATARFAQMPGVRRFSMGRHTDGTPYHCGVNIQASPSVSLVATGNFSDVTQANFAGFNNKQFHYCPDGPWADWVTLAKIILKIEAHRTEQTFVISAPVVAD